VEGVACMGYILVSRLTRPEAFASQYNGIIDKQSYNAVRYPLLLYQVQNVDLTRLISCT